MFCLKNEEVDIMSISIFADCVVTPVGRTNDGHTVYEDVTPRNIRYVTVLATDRDSGMWYLGRAKEGWREFQKHGTPVGMFEYTPTSLLPCGS